MAEPTDLQSASSRTHGSGLGVRFMRPELAQILGVYGRLVASGECRDYAIGSFPDYALFCMHQRASDAPTWVIEKRPDLARKQGAYSVSNAAGLTLRRGHDLAQVLRVFDARRFQVVE
jgi:Protein of unknown function (DUF2794)